MRALVRQYGDRTGVVGNKLRYKRAIKHGVKDLKEFLDTELFNTITNSPAIKEALAFDYDKAINQLRLSGHKLRTLGVILNEPDLRNMFGILNNMSQDEADLLLLSKQRGLLSINAWNTLQQFRDSIPLSDKIVKLHKHLNNNSMLGLIDIHEAKTGLKGPKRTTYLDILIKVLKG